MTQRTGTPPPNTPHPSHAGETLHRVRGSVFQTCRRHPQAGRFLATCPGCAQELHDLQYGTPTPDPRTAARARAALGLPATPVRTEIGEDATRIVVWSLRELDEVARRHRGRITRRDVTRTLSDGTTHTAVEVTLAARHPDFVQPIEVVTDWEPDSDPSGLSISDRLAGIGIRVRTTVAA